MSLASLTICTSILKDPVDVTGWTVAFKVDHSSMDVPKDSDEYNAVAHKAGLPGRYSIQRLYLDFRSKWSS